MISDYRLCGVRCTYGMYDVHKYYTYTACMYAFAMLRERLLELEDQLKEKQLIVTLKTFSKNRFQLAMVYEAEANIINNNNNNIEKLLHKRIIYI